MMDRESEHQSYSPWRGSTDPRRMLIIRLHALGDVAVTLPASHGLRRRYPDAQIDFVTLDPYASLLRSLRLFDRVLTVPAEGSKRERLVHALRTGARSRAQGYDVVFDLQRNWVSRTIRRIAAPRSWGEFDRFAPRTASDRVMETFRRSGFPFVRPEFSLPVEQSVQAEIRRLLWSEGCRPETRLVVLNPAGLWMTRNWPLRNYVSLARLWLKNEEVRFVLLGTDRMKAVARCLADEIGDAVVNLVGRTSIEGALVVLRCSSCVVTEDSGLMHLAWAAGRPVVALFGSSKHVWASPTGPHVRVFHSGDLPCGQCMQAQCRFGDVHCLSRHTPGTVFDAARQILPSTTLREIAAWNG